MALYVPFFDPLSWLGSVAAYTSQNVRKTRKSNTLSYSSRVLSDTHSDTFLRYFPALYF